MIDHAATIRAAIKLARVETGHARLTDNRAVGDSKRTGINGPHRAHHDLQTRLSRLKPSLYATIDEREEAARFALDMYEGRMLQYLDRLPDETPEAFEDRPGKFAIPFVAAVIDTLARLYDGTTLRKQAPESDGDGAEEFAVWAADVALDELYQIAERHLAAQGNGAVRLLWSERDQAAMPEWIPAHQIRTVPNPDDPTDPLAVIVRWMVPDASNDELVEHATIYTREEIIPMKRGAVDSDAIVRAGLEPGPSGEGYLNPYRITREGETIGIIPLALARYRRTGGDWHTDGEGQYLADTNAEINNLATTVCYQAYMQGFTPVVAVNRDQRMPIHWAPGRIIDIRMNKGEQGGLSTVALDSHIAEGLELIAVLMQKVLEAKRIPEQAVFATADASGVSIVAANTPLSEYRRASMARWRRIEQNAYVAWSAVTAYHNGEAPPEAWPTDIVLDWEDPQVAVSDEARGAQEDRDMKIGRISPVDIELRDNADAYAEYDDEDARRAAALAVMLKRKAETRAIDPSPRGVIFAPGTSGEELATGSGGAFGAPTDDSEDAPDEDAPEDEDEPEPEVTE